MKVLLVLFLVAGCSTATLTKKPAKSEACLNKYLEKDLSLNESINACNYLSKFRGKKRKDLEICLDNFLDKELSLDEVKKACNHVFKGRK